jgi:ABC-type polysaccharide/polyol phosphate export permease
MLRNEGSYLGVLWYLLDPFLLFVILLFLRGVIVGGMDDQYPIYLLIGLIVFNFFRKSSNQSINSITRNSSFVKSIKVNHESLVVSNVLQSVFSHIFEIILLVFVMIYFGNSLIGFLFYPLFFVLLIVFVQGLSFVLSVIGVYVYDLSNIWMVLTRLLWFASPIFYSLEEGTVLYTLNLFNPMFYFLDMVRNILIYNTYPSIFVILVSLLFSFGSLFVGLFVFEKVKYRFAEVV